MTPVPEALARAMQDRYRLERELGSGGMATVYLAHDLRHGRQVAVKVLHPELSAVLGGDRFLSEIKTTAALQHPHILPLFDSGDAGGDLFYVMPLVEGETLRSRLNREKQLPITVEVLPGPTFTLGRRRTVLSLAPYQSGPWQWSVGKDGRLLVLKRLSAPRDLKITVTHNLGAELRSATVR